MLKALLHGKLSREQENMEDILTSNVFGTLNYLPTSSCMVRFLSNAVLLNGDRPLAQLPLGAEIVFNFWPWLNEPGYDGCEPDVLLRIVCGDQGKYLVLVEAKYHSGKSSEAGEEIGTEDPASNEIKKVEDQLAKEWRQLEAVAEKESCQPVLIYLTADTSCPRDEIEASQKRFRPEAKVKICWLSWRDLPAIIEDEDNKMLRDLLAMLRHLNLTFFEGFSKLEPYSLDRWNFSLSFDWKCLQVTTPIRWEFKS